MSNISTPPPDFDFWEFVNCGRCQLPFASEKATVPFWLTECGHVICNNHLNADQSCPQCGTQGVQLVPLQREMDAPMSAWFHSITTALDTVTFAAKFQQETLASQIRYYRSRYQQQRTVIERLKRDIAEFKKVNDQLRRHLENGQQSLQTYDRQVSSDFPNSHGKRQMIEEKSYGRDNERPKTNSSPLSINAPLGPNRLTLPKGQQASQLLLNRHDPDHRSAPGEERPVSGFIEQYAYAPPSTSQLHSQRLSHTQAAPRLFQRTKPSQERIHTQGRRAMLPPPTPAKFKPAKMATIPSNNPNQPAAPPQRRQNMGPPPTPFEQRYGDLQSAQPPNINPANSNKQTNPVPNRFMPPVQGFSQQPTLTQHQNLVPSTPSISGPQRFVPSESRIPSRAASLSLSGGSQRVPFVPGAQGGFM